MGFKMASTNTLGSQPSSARLLIKADQLGRLQNMPLHRLLQLLFGWCPLEGKPGIQCVQFEKIPVRARGGHGPP